MTNRGERNGTREIHRNALRSQAPSCPRPAGGNPFPGCSKTQFGV